MSNKSYTLYVIDDYICGGDNFKKGHILKDLSEDKKDWYLRDAPGSFSEEAPKVEKAKGKPKKAADKAIKSSKDK